MTTIVYHDKHIAVDSQVTFGKRKVFEDKFIIHENTLYLWAGIVSDARRVIEKLIEGEEAYPPDDGTIVIKVTEDGEITVFHSDCTTTDVYTTEVWGSGADAALAAIQCGKDAKGACEIACKVDLYSGGEVKVFKVK